jgi:hypothetical protein
VTPRSLLPGHGIKLIRKRLHLGDTCAPHFPKNPTVRFVSVVSLLRSPARRVIEGGRKNTRLGTLATSSRLTTWNSCVGGLIVKGVRRQCVMLCLRRCHQVGGLLRAQQGGAVVQRNLRELLGPQRLPPSRSDGRGVIAATQAIGWPCTSPRPTAPVRLSSGRIGRAASWSKSGLPNELVGQAAHPLCFARNTTPDGRGSSQQEFVVN